MPTNVTEPDWRCDVCHTRFGTDLDTATRCEACPTPAVLPAGELVLEWQEHEDRHTGLPAGFSLRTLTPLPGLGTRTSRYGDSSGDRHYASYRLGFPPSAPDADPHSSPSGHNTRADSDGLTPHVPGHLNVRRSDRHGGWRAGRAPAGGGRYRSDPGRPHRGLLAAYGLPRSDAGLAVHPTAGVRAPTPEVLAVLDMLGVEVVRANRTFRGPDRVVSTAATVAAALERPGRPVSGARVMALAENVDRDAAVADAERRWADWRAGLPGVVPEPELRCRVRTSASKLTKTQKAAVAATGFPWETRTTSDEYVRHLVHRTLGEKMDTTDALYAGPRIVAVGGAKGGVGKSTTAAALAVRLATDGKKVVVMDADLTGPSQHILLGAGPLRARPADMALEPAPTQVPGLSVAGPGQVFADAGWDRWDERTTVEWLTFLGGVLDVADADVLVLDLPPGDGPVQAFLGRHDVTVACEVVVTTGHPLSVADTRKNAHVLSHHGAGHPRLLVETMSHATGVDAAGNETRVALFGDETAVRSLAAAEKMVYAGALPWAADVAALAATAEMGALAGLVHEKAATTR